jgi:type II secretory pathway pseudopilin PulG
MKSKSKNLKSKIRGAFTLVEVLIVVVILMLLVTILVPTVNLVRQRAKTSISQTRLALIGTACDLYRNDFGDYPLSRHQNDDYFPVNNDQYGKTLIVLLLTGYGPDPCPTGSTPGTPLDKENNMAEDDGKEGFGFRTVNRGPVLGPYNGAEGLSVQGTPPVFLDAFDNQILYYRANANGNFVADHNSDPVPYVTANDTQTDHPGPRDGTGQQILLITPGANQAWGKYESGKFQETNGKRFDDVVNFKP